MVLGFWFFWLVCGWFFFGCVFLFVVVFCIFKLAWKGSLLCCFEGRCRFLDMSIENVIFFFNLCLESSIVNSGVKFVL